MSQSDCSVRPDANRFASRYSGSYPQNVMLELADPAGRYAVQRLIQPGGRYVVESGDELVVSLARGGGFCASMDLGAGVFTTDVRSETFVIVPPRTCATFVIEQQLNVINLSCSSKVLENGYYDVDRWPTVLQKRTWSDGLINQLVKTLSDGLVSSAICRDGNAFFVDHAIQLLIGKLDQMTDHTRPDRCGIMAPWRLRRVLDFLTANIAEEISLSEIASIAGLSVFHLVRSFKLSTGLSPYRWLMLKRIEIASRRLRGTTLSISEIAASVGFSDPGYFSRVFRREMGLPPQAFRLLECPSRPVA